MKIGIIGSGVVGQTIGAKLVERGEEVVLGTRSPSNLGDKRYEMPKTLLQLTQANQLGRKSGIGIYDYSSETPKLNPAIKLGS